MSQLSKSALKALKPLGEKLEKYSTVCKKSSSVSKSQAATEIPKSVNFLGSANIHRK